MCADESGVAPALYIEVDHDISSPGLRPDVIVHAPAVELPRLSLSFSCSLLHTHAHKVDYTSEEG